MNCLRRLLQRWRDWRREVETPFDYDFPDSQPDSSPATPDGTWCPDTQPTSPGALDTLPGALK